MSASSCVTQYDGLPSERLVIYRCDLRCDFHLICPCVSPLTVCAWVLVIPDAECFGKRRHTGWKRTRGVLFSETGLSASSGASDASHVGRDLALAYCSEAELPSFVASRNQDNRAKTKTVLIVSVGYKLSDSSFSLFRLDNAPTSLCAYLCPPNKHRLPFSDRPPLSLGNAHDRHTSKDRTFMKKSAHRNPRGISRNVLGGFCTS